MPKHWRMLVSADGPIDCGLSQEDSCRTCRCTAGVQCHNGFRILCRLPSAIQHPITGSSDDVFWLSGVAVTATQLPQPSCSWGTHAHVAAVFAL